MSRLAKRVLDVCVAAIALVIFAPVMAAIAALIRLRMGSPVIFKQVRPGLNEQPFTLVKFRTMREATDASGRPLPDGLRLTTLGKLLRRSSLDELPQLWNVITGDMSLVGPRPLLLRYLPYFSELERQRFQVRPGVTGLAQVFGRNTVGWEQRLALDVAYVQQWTLGLDLKILAQTLQVVVVRRGALPDATVLMQDLDDERRESLPRGSRD